MSIVLSIIIMILILGVLVTVHEFGHYIAAKLSKIRVNEFAIGMGPKIWKKQKGETLYSIRALPIGGFCAMEGEDAESEDPHAFGNAPRWKRFIVLIAGSAMNFFIGVLVLLIISLPLTKVAEPVIDNFGAGFPYAEDGTFQVGDRIEKVNGHAIYLTSDVEMFLELGKGRPFTFVLNRDGERVELRDITFSKQTYQLTNGNTIEHSGLVYSSHTAGFGDKLKNGWFTSIDYVRVVWVSLGELIGGHAGVNDLMGPVGMGGMVNTIVETPDVPVSTKALNVLDLLALIALNLAVVNLLPLPALDGGRVLFLLVEAIRRKPLPAKAEGYVHFAGFVLFMGLMIFVFFNDILRLFGVSL